LEKDARVENVAGTTFDRIVPTNDLLLSTDSLYINPIMFSLKFLQCWKLALLRPMEG